MPIDKDTSRQYLLTAKVDFTYEDLDVGAYTKAIDVPSGARVVGGRLAITEAFNTGDTSFMSVGTVEVPSRYAVLVDGKVLGVTELTVDEAAHNESAVIINWKPKSTDTSIGAGFLEVEYVIEGRANESQLS